MPGLFDPLKVKGIELRNRIVFAPVVTNFGLRNEQTARYYAERARGGAGLIIVHGTPVDLFLKLDWVRRLRPLSEAVQREGARVVIQLWHGTPLKTIFQDDPVTMRPYRKSVPNRISARPGNSASMTNASSPDAAVMLPARAPSETVPCT